MFLCILFFRIEKFYLSKLTPWQTNETWHLMINWSAVIIYQIIPGCISLKIHANFSLSSSATMIADFSSIEWMFCACEKGYSACVVRTWHRNLFKCDNVIMVLNFILGKSLCVCIVYTCANRHNVHVIKL